MVNKVRLYSVIGCPYCILAKEFFKEHKISYENIDVGKDRKAFEYMIKISGQDKVPVIEVDDIVTIGFNKSRLYALLNIERGLKLFQ